MKFYVYHDLASYEYYTLPTENSVTEKIQNTDTNNNDIHYINITDHDNTDPHVIIDTDNTMNDRNDDALVMLAKQTTLTETHLEKD